MELFIEWLHIALRWSHIFAAILWIGTTWYFTWLDGRLHDSEENPGGKIWMVHSGGFYSVEKVLAPERMPKTLHWFKWEAGITFLTGFSLLILVYYMGGLLIDESSSRLGLTPTIGLCLALLVAGWLVYDVIWLSPLGRQPLVGAAICYALVVALDYGLHRLLTARAAYMHIGALFGTIMAANVWVRIIPAQKRMVAVAAGGAQPDPALAERAKGRSKHNTFLVMPLVFIMVSSHFPIATYGNDWNWQILAGLVLAGFGIARFVRDLR